MWIDNYGYCLQGNCFTITEQLKRQLINKKIQGEHQQILLTLTNCHPVYHWIIIVDGIRLDPASWYNQEEIENIEILIRNNF